MLEDPPFIDGKMNEDIPDYICVLCSQYYEEKCRAYSIAHSDKEDMKRNSLKKALCEEIYTFHKVSIPIEMLYFDEIAIDRSTVSGDVIIEFYATSTGKLLSFHFDGINGKYKFGRRYKYSSLSAKIEYNEYVGFFGDFLPFVLNTVKYFPREEYYGIRIKLPNILEEL